MSGRPFSKKELAFTKVQTELGIAPSQVAKMLGRSHSVVIAHLRKENNDMEVAEMVTLIRQSEMRELENIGYKARKILHKALDEMLEDKRPVQLIPVVAILDRTSQQKVALAKNINPVVDIAQLELSVKARRARLKELQERLDILEMKKGKDGTFEAE